VHILASLAQLGTNPAQGILDKVFHWILTESVHHYNSEEYSLSGVELIHFQRTQRWIIFILDRFGWKSFGPQPRKRIKVCEEFTWKLVNFILSEEESSELLTLERIEAVRCLQLLVCFNLKTGLWNHSWIENSILAMFMQTFKIKDNPNRSAIYASAVLSSSCNLKEESTRKCLAQYLTQSQTSDNIQTCIISCVGLDILSNGNPEYFSAATQWYSEIIKHSPEISQILPSALLTDLQLSLTLQ